jgi:hypothetical protein
MLSARSILTLIWRNGLAYLLSVFTASLFFPLLLLLWEPNSTYGWWFVLILSGLGMTPLLWPVLLLIFLFNVIARKSKLTRVKQFLSLGIGLGVAFFSCMLLYTFKSAWNVLFQNLLLMSGIGALFGFYYYHLIHTSRHLTSP